MQFVFAIALLLVSAVISALNQPKPPPPANLGQFNFPQYDDGTPQTIIFGDVWITDWFVLWYGDLSSQAIYGGGGKK